LLCLGGKHVWHGNLEGLELGDMFGFVEAYVVCPTTTNEQVKAGGPSLLPLKSPLAPLAHVPKLSLDLFAHQD
jgi:hypothetical protein